MAKQPPLDQQSSTLELRELVVNGERRRVKASTLSHALDELGFAPAKVATAVNGDFVSAPRRASCTLAPGDRIEVVAAREGG